MHWIQSPIILNGRTVDLIPLEKAHLPALEKIASDKSIWEFMSFPCDKPERFKKLYESAFEEKENGSQYPFAIFHKHDQKIIGSTRFIDLTPAHRKLEIGWTWLDPAYWATDVNPECKLLLLTYCFEHLNTSRVQLRTSDQNIRSQKAIAKIGARHEGVLRNDIIKDDGTKRNSVYFSIIEEEWPHVKPHLEALYLSKKGTSGLS